MNRIFVNSTKTTPVALNVIYAGNSIIPVFGLHLDGATFLGFAGITKIRLEMVLFY